jgi:sugar diacid utilization regulator
VKCLLTIRSNGVVLVVADELDWTELARVIEAEGACNVRLGVGGPHRLEDLRRSLADAEFSLRLSSVTDKPITLFDELGVWRILARQDVSDLQELVDSWIGKLIVYDREHHSELLKTLFAYLNESGALEATAAKLYVHRNTLKYRLTRVEELTGWDLDDPEQRFHLNLACRAYEVWQALESSEAGSSDPRADHSDNGAATTTLSQLTRPLVSSPGSSARGHARSNTRRPSPA